MRRQSRNPKLFNVAADLEIHFILTDEKLKAPFVLPHDANWRGLSAEEIYERYPKFLEGCGMSGGQESEHIKRGGGNEGSDSFDSHPIKDGERQNGDGMNGLCTIPGREGIGHDPDYNPLVRAGAEDPRRLAELSLADQTAAHYLQALREIAVSSKDGWKQRISHVRKYES